MITYWITHSHDVVLLPGCPQTQSKRENDCHSYFKRGWISWNTISSIPTHFEAVIWVCTLPYFVVQQDTPLKEELMWKPQNNPKMQCNYNFTLLSIESAEIFGTGRASDVPFSSPWTTKHAMCRQTKLHLPVQQLIYASLSSQTLFNFLLSCWVYVSGVQQVITVWFFSNAMHNTYVHGQFRTSSFC